MREAICLCLFQSDRRFSRFLTNFASFVGNKIPLSALFALSIIICHNEYTSYVVMFAFDAENKKNIHTSLDNNVQCQNNNFYSRKIKKRKFGAFPLSPYVYERISKMIPSNTQYCYDIEKFETEIYCI